MRPSSIARLFVVLSVLTMLWAWREPASASTAAGTAIVNTGTYTYTGSFSTTYSGQSNTLTTYVQNAPSLTITNPSTQNITPAMVAVDTFTLTNTGNNVNGTFALTGAATLGGTGSATVNGFVLNGATSGTCSIAVPCAYTTLNAQAGMATTGSTVTVGVEYTVSASATSGQTIQPSITANIAYVAGTGTSAATSTNVTNTTYSETLIADARLDVQASATIPGSSGANITWTVTANNGGGVTAQGLLAAKTVFGATNVGVAIFAPVPAFSGTSLVIQSAPSAPTLSGASGGTSATAYYNSAACSTDPTSGWTTTGWSTAKCIAMYTSVSSGRAIFPSATSGSSGAGSVTTPQITFSFVTNQPSGTGSTNANAVTLIASSAIGGNSWATNAVPILGQGLAVGSTTDASTASLLNAIQSNSTSSSGTTPPGGASNQAGSQAYSNAGDARVDLALSATQPGNGSAIPYVLKINNGGGLSTTALAINNALTGVSSTQGVFVSVPVPVWSSAPLAVSGVSVSTGNGYSGTVTPYYTTDSTGKTGWTTTAPSAGTAYFIGLYTSNMLPANASGSTAWSGSTAPTVTSPQITFDFNLAQPIGHNAASAGSVLVVADSVIGNNASPQQVIGPGSNSGTAYNNASINTYIQGMIANTTATSATSPGGSGYSGQTSNYGNYEVYVGPKNTSTAQGAWNGIAPGYTGSTADYAHDFTFVGLVPTSTPANSATNSAGAPSGNSVTTGGTAVNIVNGVRNSGAITDSFVLSSSSISGWTVAFYSDTGCTVSLTSNTESSVASGSVAKPCIKFTPPTNVTAFQAYDFTITATSAGNGSVVDTAHDVIYPGGPLVLFRNATVSGCPGGVTPPNGGAISGCTITFTVTAVNESALGTAGGGSGNSPLTTGSVTVTENGTATGNTWAANTGGLTSAGVTLTSCASCTTTGTTGSTNFTVTIPALAPQATATYSFSVVVN